MGNQGSTVQLNEYKSDAFVVNQVGVRPHSTTRNMAVKMKTGTTQIYNPKQRQVHHAVPNSKTAGRELLPKYDRRETKVKWATPAPNANQIYQNAMHDMNMTVNFHSDPLVDFACQLVLKQKELREAGEVDTEVKDHKEAEPTTIFDAEFSDFFARHFKMTHQESEVEVNEMFFKENFQPEDLAAMREKALNSKTPQEELTALSKELTRGQQVFYQVMRAHMENLSTPQALFFFSSMMQEYEHSIQKAQNNPYLGLMPYRVHFGDDIKDIYWNPYGKCWQAPDGRQVRPIGVPATGRTMPGIRADGGSSNDANDASIMHVSDRNILMPQQ